MLHRLTRCQLAHQLGQFLISSWNYNNNTWFIRSVVFEDFVTNLIFKLNIFVETIVKLNKLWEQLVNITLINTAIDFFIFSFLIILVLSCNISLWKNNRYVLSNIMYISNSKAEKLYIIDAAHPQELLAIAVF
jgi:hypothetical protein